LIANREFHVHQFDVDCVPFPWNSAHQDHTATYKATMAALRPHNCRTVNTVLAYKTLKNPWSEDGDRLVWNAGAASPRGLVAVNSSHHDSHFA
jgi:LmbE family N-acetylglucosaminyl deacetylase